MRVGFLTREQRDCFGRYVDTPSREQLERYFYLSNEDREAIQTLRGDPVIIDSSSHPRFLGIVANSCYIGIISFCRKTIKQILWR